MSRTTHTQPAAFKTASCDHDHIGTTLNELYFDGYNPTWKIYTNVDPDGVRFFTIEAMLDLERYGKGRNGAPDQYFAVRTSEAKLEAALNKVHSKGYDPRKQYSHRDKDGKRQFLIVGVLSEQRFVDPAQEEMPFTGKPSEARGTIAKLRDVIDQENRLKQRAQEAIDKVLDGGGTVALAQTPMQPGDARVQIGIPGAPVVNIKHRRKPKAPKS